MDESEVQRRIEAVAAQLRAERAAVQMTYQEVADRAGMEKMTVNRYMNGKRDIPMGKLAAICDAMGVRIGDLMARAEDRLS